jgi:polyvinyl alcohol dehydrogenase (cytochrome)
LLPAQDGAALYKERCASCHDAPEGRVPAIGVIKKMSGGAIYAALTNGAMKSQASDLSLQQMIALLNYIAPSAASNTKPAFEKTCPSGALLKFDQAKAWGGWSPTVTNSRFQEGPSAGLSAGDVPRLKLKWAFNLGEVTLARGQPAVIGNRVFIGTQKGDVYSIDTITGCVHWGFHATTGVRSGVTAGEANGAPAIFFGDGVANVYALNAATGDLLWKTKPVDHLLATSTASPQFYKDVLYMGFSSIEEGLAADPKSTCCNFRGTVVAMDAASGKIIWKSFTIIEPARPTGTGNHTGPSGAGVWSTPTIDEQRGALYVSTGDNYSNPATDTSDAVLAFELKTGAFLWSRQLTQGDAYNVGCSMPTRTNCPTEDGPDYDFGQPPILVSLGGGKRALVIGQKSGLVHAIDPDAEGRVLWQMRVGSGSKLGGSQWGSAADFTRST